jgi:hypothetical protein
MVYRTNGVPTTSSSSTHDSSSSFSNATRQPTVVVPTEAVASAASAAAATTTNAAAAAAANLEMMSDQRMEQLLDEQDHVRCSEGNQKALIAEKIASLRRLVTEIEADAWQFEYEMSSMTFRNGGNRMGGGGGGGIAGIGSSMMMISSSSYATRWGSMHQHPLNDDNIHDDSISPYDEY